VAFGKISFLPISRGSLHSTGREIFVLEMNDIQKLKDAHLHLGYCNVSAMHVFKKRSINSSGISSASPMKQISKKSMTGFGSKKAHTSPVIKSQWCAPLSEVLSGMPERAVCFAIVRKGIHSIFSIRILFVVQLIF
jgi:hypothetical protein